MKEEKIPTVAPISSSAMSQHYYSKKVFLHYNQQASSLVFVPSPSPSPAPSGTFVPLPRNFGPKIISFVLSSAVVVVNVVALAFSRCFLHFRFEYLTLIVALHSTTYAHLLQKVSFSVLNNKLSMADDAMDTKINVGFLTDRGNLEKTKLDALSLGILTDCAFSVGPEKGPMTTVHSIKAEMKIASPVFQDMLSIEGQVDVRIMNVDANLFKLMVEFIHLNKVVSQPVDSEVAIELAILAKTYGVASLRNYCTYLIKSELTVDTIWTFLDKVLAYSLIDVARAGSELMSSETLQCLEHPHFLTASTSSIIFMLQQNNLSIKSEKNLIDFCCKWAHQQQSKKQSLRKLLPYLRLRTLSTKEVSQLPDILSDKEKLALVMDINCKNSSKDIPSTLCPLTSSRIQTYKEVTCILIPDSLLLNVRDMSWSMRSFSPSGVLMNVLCITPKVDIYLTQINYLSQIHELPKIVKNKESGLYEDVPQEKSYKFKISVKIDPPGRTNNLEGQADYNDISRYIFYPIEPTLIPENIEAKISMTNTGTKNAYFRKIEAASLQKNSSPDVFKSIYLGSPSLPAFIRSFSYIVKK